MPEFDDSELETLLKRAGLSLTEEERGWVSEALAGYLPLVDELHALDLTGEEVGTAYLPQGEQA